MNYQGISMFVRYFFRIAALGLSALPLAAGLPAMAQGNDAAAPAAGPTLQAVAQLPPISLFAGHATLIHSSSPIKEVSLTDPKIADVRVVNPTQLMISGKNVGSTDLIIWSDNGQASQAAVIVGVDQAALRIELARMLPTAKLKIDMSNDVLVVSGKLDRAEDAQGLHRFLDTAQVKYLDMTSLSGVQQVQIKVTVAEASRVAIRALGINAVQSGGSFFGGSTIGADGGGPLNPISIGAASGASATGARVPFTFLSDTTVSPAATLFGGFPDANLELFVQALEENQYMRVLAEPNLVALSGQEASFLAGGEFPIPVVQGGGGGGTGSGVSISIEYKDFGVRLRFVPTVLGDGRIRLHVAPEVSELSTGTGSVEIQGFNIPAILTRRAETTIELCNGQSFAMGGLISQETSSRSSQVPGLGDLPVIGSLFRSVRYQQQDTELVLLVTASLVEPGAHKLDGVVPGSLHKSPDDWELYALGRIEGRTAGKLSPADAEMLRQSGLGRLRGPGAWAGYEAQPPDSPRQDAPSTPASDAVPVKPSSALPASGSDAVPASSLIAPSVVEPAAVPGRPSGTTPPAAEQETGPTPNAPPAPAPAAAPQTPAP